MPCALQAPKGIAICCAGAAPPAEDIPLPEMMGAEESEALATTLYASDFISQFAEVLELQQGLTFLRLHVRPG